MVAARETTIQELLQASIQYQIPLYQRTYSWTDAQLDRLWKDIVKVAIDRLKDAKADHFIGSLVLAPSPSNGPTGVQEFLVVDGQQRLTTLSVLLCAVRDHRGAHESPEHAERISDHFLVNKWAKKHEQKAKLAPTQADRPSYEAILYSTPNAGGVDRIGSAFRFFQGKLLNLAAEAPELSAEDVEEALTSGLALVSVTAQPGDNAHRIFESLNNTGLKLTQGDLLRNYVFMRMPDRGPSVYTSLWKPLQDSLSPDDLELLFWLDLVQIDPRIKQSDTYSRQQARLDGLKTEEAIEAEVTRWSVLGTLLRTMLDPTSEPHPDVRQRLARLNEWGTTTVRPLQLHLLSQRDAGTATSDEVARALLTIESFLVRRLLVGRATAGLNRILLDAAKEMDQDAAVDVAVLEYLSTGRKHFATDEDLRAGLPAIPFYLHGRPRQKFLVLAWIEETYGSKEPVDTAKLTIEHVLPQTLTPAWSAELARDEGHDDESIGQLHQSLVHTLGNLTLTGYNATLSNNPFPAKRQLLAQSGVRMNQDIAKHETWGREEITQRSLALADLVAATWPGPSSTPAPGPSDDGVRWDLLNEALAHVPAGHWTTYGDLAALLGVIARVVGTRLATVATPNPHRVLRAGGMVSPDFVWLDPSNDASPRTMLEAEGVTFDDKGRAAGNRHIDSAMLAELIEHATVDVD
ncbi:hypothetical protein Acsp07_13060 [Actinomycetospora sp. NBRC 106378]|nr:hypothetical protein Acsp07_13060 [Actinomycetospora sp. NBRC 106378]